MTHRSHVLQAYSQDAYLKGNEAYSGNAQNIPEPPPICYPRIEVKTQTSESATAGETLPGSAQGAGRQGGAAEKSYRVEIPVPPSATPPQQSPRTAPVSLDPVERGSRVARAGPSHRTEENRYSPSAASLRSKPFSPPGAGGGAQVQHSSAHPSEAPVFSLSSGVRAVHISSDKLSSPVRSGLSPASPDTFSSQVNHCSPSPPAASQHQNIDWKNYTTYKDYIDAKRLHTYGCRTIQERLDSLRAAASSSSAYAQQRPAPPPSSTTGPRGAPGSQVKRRSTSTERGTETSSRAAARTPLRSASQERLGSERTGQLRNWPRSASEDALPLSSPAGFTKARARSWDYLGKQPGDAGVASAGDQTLLEDGLRLFRGEEARGSRPGPAGAALPYLPQNLPGKEDEGQAGVLAYAALAAPLFTKAKADSRTDCVILRPSRLPVKNSLSDPSAILSTIRTTEPLKDQRANIIGNHISYSSPLPLQLRGRADSLRTESRAVLAGAPRSLSCSAPSSKLPMLRSSDGHLPASTTTINGDVGQKATPGGPARPNGGLFQGVEGPDATVVVLRRDKISGPAHARPPSYVLALDDDQKDETHRSPPLVKAGSVDGAMCWMSDSCRERHHRRLGDARHRSKRLDDSLDSIPFIGETTSGN